MGWTLAPSLKQLVVQYNELYPGRNKASDGTIGDAAHAARVSDHTPDANGVVAALDITHDPAHGLDIAVESEKLVNSLDPRIKYVIANKRIWEPGKGWKPYTGANPHTAHMHVSVKQSNYHDATKWKIGGNMGKMDREDVKELYRLGLNREVENEKIIDNLEGKDFDTEAKKLRNSGERKAIEFKIKDYDRLAKENEELKKSGGGNVTIVIPKEALKEALL
jgi:hypothetical protein